MSCSSSCDGCWNGLKDCATLLLELVDRSASDGLKHDRPSVHRSRRVSCDVTVVHSALDELAVILSALDELAVMSLWDTVL